MTIGEDRAAARGLFWRRLAAGAIDVALFAALSLATGVLLYGASDGRLRSSAPFAETRCAPLRALSAKVFKGVAMPAGAQAVAARRCTVSLAGLETSRYVSVVLQAQDGEVTRSLSFSRPVDRTDAPVSPVILDWTYPLAFILVAALCEGLAGATPGKRALGLKVIAASGGRLGLPRALARNLVVYGGGTLVLIAPLAAALAGVRLTPTLYYLAVGVFGLLILAPFAMLAEAQPRARYDRWVGAEVIGAG